MRMREDLLKQFPVLRGITRTSRSQVLLLHAKMCINQYPGVITKKIPKLSKCVTMLIALLNPLRKRGIENIEERGVQEREKTEVNLLFMMRAGPISAQQFQAVQSFQQEWPSQPLRPSTPYLPCGQQCTRLSNLSVTHRPMKIRRSK